MSFSFRILSTSLGIFLAACASSSGTSPAQTPPAASASGSAGAEQTPQSAAAQAPASQPASDKNDTQAVDPSLESKEGSASESTVVAAEPAALPLPEGSKILQVGDSFAGALGLPLAALLEDAGVHSILKHTDASYLTDWAWNGELQKFIWKYNPDLVIVTLGANELGIAQPEQRIKTINKIVSVIGERPCLWVGIPLWQGKQNGLMDIIKENVGPCVYWDSNELVDVENMPRIHDGIHPTTAARKQWAEQVFAWLELHRAPTEQQIWALQP